jgi:succinyl-diaminopimelate desuccinylase
LELQERLFWLCGIASVTGAENQLANELQQKLEAAKLPDSVRRHGDSLVAPLTQKSGGPNILLVAQLDTLALGQPPSAREEGGRVYGAGSADSKSALCLLLDLAERQPKLKADVTIVLHARGEAGADGSELGLVMRKEPELGKADFALVLKGTDNKLELGSGGSTHALLAFAGRSAHSGLPGAGVNAIHRFARVVSDLATAEPVPDVVEGLTWYEIMNATAAHAGQPLSSVVPNELEVNLHHTFGPSTSLHDSQEKLMALMNRLGAVRFEELSAAAAPNRQHALVRSLEQSGSLAVEARQTWTEVSRFAALGMAAANFGPGAERSSHSRQEYTELSALAAAQTILARWLATLG